MSMYWYWCKKTDYYCRGALTFTKIYAAILSGLTELLLNYMILAKQYFMQFEVFLIQLYDSI